MTYMIGMMDLRYSESAMHSIVKVTCSVWSSCLSTPVASSWSCWLIGSEARGVLTSPQSSGLNVAPNVTAVGLTKHCASCFLVLEVARANKGRRALITTTVWTLLMN